MATRPDDIFRPQEVVYQSNLPGVMPLEGRKDWAGWFDAVGDAVALQPIWQTIGRTQDIVQGYDPEYDPFTKDEIGGYEEYVDDFVGVRNRAEAQLLRKRIDRNRERRANVEEHLGLGGILVSELLNPVNLIPLPGMVGAGAIKGALRSTASFGGLLGAEELLRHGVDPTATTAESVDNMVYGTLFGGLVGGGLGMVGARDSARLAQEYQRHWDRIEQDGGLPAEELDAVMPASGEFEAKPTSGAGTGVAPGYGLEQQTKMTLWGKLKASGLRAAEDFADGMLGDFGTMSSRNRVGQSTETSAFLASGYWRGMSADVSRRLQRLYARYLTGGEGKEVAGLNLAVTGSRVKQWAGRGAPEGKMTYEEFKEAIFRAHKTDRIETDDPFVKEGAGIVRGLFDRAAEEGVKTGAIRSKAGLQHVMQRKTERGRAIVARIDELLMKQDKTANDMLELEMLGRSEERLIGWLDKRLDLSDLDEDATLSQILTEVNAKQLARREELRKTAKDIRGKGKERRDTLFNLQRSIRESIAERAEKDRAILDHLNRLEEERGLTENQRAFRDQLREDLELLGDDYGATVRQGEVLDDVERQIDEARGQPGLIFEPTGMTEAKRLPRNGSEATKFLQSIEESSTNPRNKALAKRLRQMLEGSTTKVRFATGSEEMAEIAGQFVGNAHAYAYFKGKEFGIILNVADGKYGRMEEVILHEAIHIAIFERIGQLKLADVSNIDQLRSVQEAIDDMARMQDDVRAVANDMDPYLAGVDGFHDIDEFITWGLTDPNFREMLRRMPPGAGAKGRKVVGEDVPLNRWEEFVNIVMRILGMEPKFKPQVREVIEFDARNALEEADGKFGQFMEMLDKMPKDLRGRKEAGLAKMSDGTAAMDDSLRDGTAFLTDKQRAYLKALEDRLAGRVDKFSGPKNESFYLPRYWLIDEILADEAGPQELRGILYNWFEENPLEGVPNTPSMIEGRVEETINRITKQAELGELQMMPNGGGASFMASRGLDIPNELVANFIETDVERLSRSYGQRFGTMNEIARKFGEIDAGDAIDDVLLQMAREMDASNPAKAMEQIEAMRRDLERARDTATGAIYSQEPAMLNKRRLAGGLRAYGVVTSLGRAALSSIPEVGRAFMVHGFRRTFAAIAQAMFDPKAFGAISDRMAVLTGEGLDVTLATGLNRFVEQGGPTGAASTRAGRAMHKLSDFASGPYFILNGLSMMTDLTKRMSLVFTHNFMLEDLGKLAAGKGGKKLEARLASYGLSKADAEAIMKMPLEKTEGGLFLANVSEWSDDALARRYLGAVTGMVRRIVPTAGHADVPEIAKGFVKGREFPLLTLPFQFMNYGFAAANKVALSALQGRDESAWVGLAGLMGLGYLTTMIKTPEGYWDNMPMEERAARAVDQSGVAGIYSDIPTMIEAATLGEVGLRPALGLDPYNRDGDYFDAVGEFSGPVGGRIADVVKLFVDGDTDAKDVSGTVRRSLPLNNLFYWRNTVIDLERDLMSAATEE